jgi:pimeloyl-ACP methyl ester carboxylesterase
VRGLRALVPLLLLVALSTPTGAWSPAAVSENVAFEVSNPLGWNQTYVVRGVLVRPVGCSSSVLVAEHGVSYGAWAWDFPYRPETYSMARALAARGYSTLALDRLGYGRSDHPNGYTITVEFYADIARQVVDQLRAGTYQGESPTAFSHVGLIGHSGGSEVVELAAGAYRNVDVVIPTAYLHAPWASTDWLVKSWVAGDFVRSAQSDYEYRGASPKARSAEFYNLSTADPHVVALDNELANLAPSGEIYSLSTQPSRGVLGNIRVPVFLVLAENDGVFPVGAGPNELALFTGSNDKTMHVVPKSGHTFMLHPNAPDFHRALAKWLDTRQQAMPRC